MSTTTALDLLARADLLTRKLRTTTVTTSPQQWDTFDVTLHRLLTELAGDGACHVANTDPSYVAMHAAARTYPTPLRPPLDAFLRPSQAARYMACDATTVKVRMRSGHLRVVSEGHQDFVPSHAIDIREDIRPADPTDPHPLARISCVLGAMADLIHDARRDDRPVLPNPGEIAGAIQHVLSLAAVTARHTLAHSPLDDAVRPLLIARYAERVIDSLRDVALRPASLDRLASTAPEAQPRTLPDRLEATLDAWHHSARAELERTIPSVDVLRQIANQGSHLCAVLELTEGHMRDGAAGEGATYRDALRETRSALAAGDKAWAKLTTLTRPSHEFVTSSRDLFTALRDVATGVQRADNTVNAHILASHLAHGLTRVADLMATTEALPGLLMHAGILRAPATAIRATNDRLIERAHRQHVKVIPEDIPELSPRWADACAQALNVERMLEFRSCWRDLASPRFPITL